MPVTCEFDSQEVKRVYPLSFEDVRHYPKIVVALEETMRLMEEIDAIIDTHGGWPIA